MPRKGTRVFLRNNANLSTGGTATDVTDDVHPEIAARAVAAAKMIGLDLCGVDVVCESVLRPLENQAGGVIEVNAAPGLRMHLQPVVRQGPPGGRGHHLHHVRGRRGRPHPGGRGGRHQRQDHHGAPDRAHPGLSTGKRVGMTNTDGIYIAGQRIDTGDCSGPRSARNVLFHPDVDAAVLETARGGILREGLGFDRCNVAVVTNIGMGDHLGLNYISTVEDLAVVKRVIVHSVAPDGVAVLNAADPSRRRDGQRLPGIGHLLRPRPPRTRCLPTTLPRASAACSSSRASIVAAKGKLRYRLPA